MAELVCFYNAICLAFGSEICFWMMLEKKSQIVGISHQTSRKRTMSFNSDDDLHFSYPV